MMLFAVHGSTDLSLEGVAFTTPGMQDLVNKIMSGSL